jgi:hypothetical protein
MEGQEADGELYPIAVLIDELKVGVISLLVPLLQSSRDDRGRSWSNIAFVVQFADISLAR